jgi:hypothetical protein
MQNYVYGGRDFIEEEIRREVPDETMAGAIWIGCDKIDESITVLSKIIKAASLKKDIYECLTDESNEDKVISNIVYFASSLVFIVGCTALFLSESANSNPNIPNRGILTYAAIALIGIAGMVVSADGGLTIKGDIEKTFGEISAFGEKIFDQAAVLKVNPEVKSTFVDRLKESRAQQVLRLVASTERS